MSSENYHSIGLEPSAPPLDTMTHPDILPPEIYHKEGKEAIVEGHLDARAHSSYINRKISKDTQNDGTSIVNIDKTAKILSNDQGTVLSRLINNKINYSNKEQIEDFKVHYHSMSGNSQTDSNLSKPMDPPLQEKAKEDLKSSSYLFQDYHSVYDSNQSGYQCNEYKSIYE